MILGYFFCLPKSRWIGLKTCDQKHFTGCRFWGQIGEIPKPYDIAVQKKLGMHHRNKSVYVIHIIVFMFCTLRSQLRHHEDMLPWVTLCSQQKYFEATLERVAYWFKALKFWIGRTPVQTLLGAQPGFRTQPCYKAASDLWLK